MNTSLSLDSLASAINAAHTRCERSYVTMLEDAKCAGELLLQAKSQLPHGQWTAWLSSNCAFSDRTAQRYMQIASSWDSLQSKTDTVADLGVRMACEMIAQEKVFDKPDEPSNMKSASHIAAPRGNLPTTKKPDIRPGDRVTVTDPESPEYGQELEVTEVVQDAIALVKKGGETYPLLVNQVEVVERPTPPLQQVAESIKPIPKGGNLERFPQTNGGTSNTVAPPSLPQENRDAGPPKNNTSPQPLLQCAQSTKEVTVAALQDILRRILDECEEYLPQELIDEARELLK